jgi:hypothetical protein
VLLLEATRYLRLSPAQLQQMLPLVNTAEERLKRFDQENAEAISNLKSRTSRYRDALVSGQVPPSQVQTDALSLTQLLHRKRTRLEDQVVEFIQPRLARILSREQIQQAYLLALGQTPEKVRPNPILFAPGSGFVLTPEAQREWRATVERRVLSRRHPPQLVEATMHPLFGEVNGGLDQPNSGRNSEEQALADILVQYPPEARTAVRRDRAGLGERWRNLRTLLLEGASDQEKAVALEMIVRRLFLSPRLKPVLQERTQNHARISG